MRGSGGRLSGEETKGAFEGRSAAQVIVAWRDDWVGALGGSRFAVFCKLLIAGKHSIL